MYVCMHMPSIYHPFSSSTGVLSKDPSEIPEEASENFGSAAGPPTIGAGAMINHG